ncbi:helix-turn-helix transcriptional regulator [Dyadobacter luticola]|uniref:Tetratricopeptide repeat protein n=1 Tax=Dyadobacter luticola TaxID=1979387 RepID=A0A5R9L3I7_9BACT|nr:hypothetical protein [Dyadobacter luticola]TLV02947.1 hypothetical protein FEN17_04865 [Dyadobacter luticola]
MPVFLQKRFAFLFLFVLASSPGAAQFEHWLNKKHAERYSDMRNFIDHNVNHIDTVTTNESIAKIRSQAARAGDDELLLEADYIHIAMLTSVPGMKPGKVINELNALITKADQQENQQMQIRARVQLAHVYWYFTKNYEKAFELFFDIHKRLAHISGKELPEKAVILTRIGESYYFFANYKSAITFSREALKAEVIFEHLGVHNIAMNTIGLSYIKEGMLDSADFYFQKIIENVKLGDYNVWKGIAQGDLGHTAYLRGNYEKALPLLLSSVNQAKLIGDFEQAAGSMTRISDIYFRQKRFADAAVAMKDAQGLISRTNPPKKSEQLYQVFAKVNAAQGNFDLTNTYLDSANQLHDKLAKEFNSIQMLRASERSKLQEHRATLESIAAEQQIKTLERNILFILIILLIVLALYFYKTYYYQVREKQRRSEDQLKRAEQELNFATQQLEEFTRSISEKNQLVEELTARYGMSANDQAVAELQKITILTDEQWEYFRRLFDKIHVGYLSRLREKLPGLTPAETRFMALAKLNLGYKEMASTLGISVQSVRVIRHRIRKKLNLPEESNLNDVVGSI